MGNISFTYSIIVSNVVCQGGMLLSKLFAIYINDLSQDLTIYTFGCHVDDQCINTMYADDICHPALNLKIMSCINVRLNGNILDYIFTMNSQDVDVMLRQMCTLFIRFNKLLRTFYHCSIDYKF